MNKFLVGIGILLAVLLVINFNKGRNLRQIELAADISCATLKAWEKYGVNDLPPKKWTQRRVGVSIKAGS